ncbi:MAG: 50S ribosomal protein L16 [Bacilli bacterium]|nr:50S ribosomal protein L16 [Bacilli bacterium]
MMMPKRTKYRRPHIVKYEGHSKGGTEVNFGEFGLQATEGGWISDKQIEAARVCMSRYTRRGGKVWIRIFPQLCKTKRPIGLRMGSGKGSPDSWVAVVKEGRVMFEIGGIDEAMARKALSLASYKLPVGCKIVERKKAGAE